MQNMVETMYENGVVEEDDRTWGALVVLFEKPHQENVPCHEYQWRLCVSYRKPNQVTHPFTSPYLSVMIHHRKPTHKHSIL